jgi:AraC family transcriptional regulator of adaptative response/methylated-DNA-[protein]-cysteine methyltransferase
MTTPVVSLEQLSADYQLVEQAIQFLEANVSRQPKLQDVASALGLSEWHFQRRFTRWAGISPKRFLQFLTKESARECLDRSESLLSATVHVGLSSPGRLHDLFVSAEALTPGEYKSRGAGVTIRFGLHPTPFGECLIGITERGICHLGFVTTSAGQALETLRSDWPRAELVEDRSAAAPHIEAIFALGEGDSAPLHVHLQGTNFQIKVWEALLRIPAGALSTYGRLAAGLGKPNAARAVGSALAQNPVAVLIPCHRVIRGVGGFGEYRYGSPRKKALVAWEMSRPLAAEELRVAGSLGDS